MDENKIYSPLGDHSGLDSLKTVSLAIVVIFPSGIERILRNIEAGKTDTIYETDIDPAQYEKVIR